jgi:CheY-like chemotaxis protein/HPt (histidine-containing phosphotransfer) domain-containing protein
VALPCAEQGDGSRDREVQKLLGGLQALVIDDNATNRRVLEHMLVQWGADVQTADSGARALSLMEDAARRGRPFALVLLDSNMPAMDGFSFAEHLQRKGGPSPSAIMMLSSAHRPGDLARCHDLGIAMHLIKPVGRDDLGVAIANVLAQGQAVTAGKARENLAAAIGRHSATAASESGAQAAASASPRASAAGLSVLVAEDNPVNVKYVVALLEKWGHRVTVATNGREAIDRAMEQRFDIALLDVQMPEVGGLDVARRIRTDEATTGDRLPIIALTARAMKGDREECLEAGMDDYVSKPIKADTLKAAIERAMGAPAASQTSKEAAARRPRPELVEHNQLLAELAAMFLTERPRWVEEIRHAVKGEDARLLERSAHHLKGAVGFFRGSEAAARLCSELENLGRAGRTDGADRLFATLEAEVAKICALLETLVRKAT